MARVNFFKGRSTQSLLSADISEFMSWGEQQLRQAVSRIASTANKRIKKLQSSSTFSPALYEVGKSGGKFSTRSKDINQLRAEFLREKDFIEAPTSTLSGARELETQAREELESRGFTISNADYNTLMNQYVRIKDADPELQARILKYRVLQNSTIQIQDEDLNTDDLTRRMVNILNSLYQPGGSQYAGVADFFELE